jgi:hypothetical protein
MSQELKQSTTVTVKVGPFLDRTDAFTEEDGLAGSMVVQLSKNGGAFAARNSATAITLDTLGWYNVELNGTDTDTAGLTMLRVHDNATHLPVWIPFQVLPANVYDSKYGSDKLQVDVVEWGGAAPNALVAGRVDADMGAISTDAVAADNLEAVLDGTGGAIDLKARSLVISNSTGTAVKFESTGSNGAGLECLAHGTNSGLRGVGGATNGRGAEFFGVGNATAFYCEGGGSGGHGIDAQAQGGTSAGIRGVGSMSGGGIRAEGGQDGPGFRAVGGLSTGDGILAEATTLGHGLRIIGKGAAKLGIYATSALSDGVKFEALGGNGAGFQSTGNGTGPRCDERCRCRVRRHGNRQRNRSLERYRRRDRGDARNELQG